MCLHRSNHSERAARTPMFCDERLRINPRITALSRRSKKDFPVIFPPRRLVHISHSASGCCRHPPVFTELGAISSSATAAVHGVASTPRVPHFCAGQRHRPPEGLRVRVILHNFIGGAQHRVCLVFEWRCSSCGKRGTASTKSTAP